MQRNRASDLPGSEFQAVHSIPNAKSGFSRVSRVHPLLITPRDVRFTRDFSIAPSLTQGAAQKLRCAPNDFAGDFPFEVFAGSLSIAVPRAGVKQVESMKSYN